MGNNNDIKITIEFNGKSCSAKTTLTQLADIRDVGLDPLRLLFGQMLKELDEEE